MTTRPDEMPMTWAILAPLAAPELRRHALQAKQAMSPSDDAGWPKTWQLRAGAGIYSVLIETEPGAEDTVEEPLVASITESAREPAYVIYFEHDSGEPHQVIERTRYGERLLDRSPYALAESLGCPLPTPPPMARGFEGQMITVAPGIAVESVPRAVGDALRDAGYELVPCARGTALRHPALQMLPEPPKPLVHAFPDAVLIVVTIGPERGRFTYWEYRDGMARAAFVVPPSPILAIMKVAELDAVGETRDPARILQNLGLDPAVLDAD